MVRDFWAVCDPKHSIESSGELSDGTPAIYVVDKSDFKSGTLKMANCIAQMVCLYSQTYLNEMQIIVP